MSPEIPDKLKDNQVQAHEAKAQGFTLDKAERAAQLTNLYRFGDPFAFVKRPLPKSHSHESHKTYCSRRKRAPDPPDNRTPYEKLVDHALYLVRLDPDQCEEMGLDDERAEAALFLDWFRWADEPSKQTAQMCINLFSEDGLNKFLDYQDEPPYDWRYDDEHPHYYTHGFGRGVKR